MASGKRILGLLLTIFGFMALLLGAVHSVALLDDPLTFSVYIWLAAGVALLVAGIKRLRARSETVESTAPSLTADTNRISEGTKAATGKALGGSIGAVVLVVAYGWYFVGGGFEVLTNQTMQGITDKVATDAVAQYGIAKRNGTAMDACIQAGFVSAAYLQAQNEPQYQLWKQTEKADCAKAGLDR